MSKVRVISQGTTDNYEAFSGLVKRMCAHVEEHEPGAIAYECFADQTTGQALWHEIYQDADAFLAHVQGLTDTGLMDQLISSTRSRRSHRWPGSPTNGSPRSSNSSVLPSCTASGG